MKYLHLVQWSPRNSFGGYETIVRDAALAQRKRGDTVYIVGRVQGESRKIQSTIVDGVTYVEVSHPMARRPSSLDVGIIGIGMLFVEIFVSLWLLTPVIIRMLRKERIDAVIFYGIHLMLMGPIVRLAGSKALLGLEVLQKNQIVPSSSFLYWFRRVKYACFNGMFTYTKFFTFEGKTYNNIALLKTYAPHTLIGHIPWGIDVDETKKTKGDSALLSWKKKTKSVIILCPRRLVEEKGVRYLLEAVPGIAEKIPNALVIFAGDGILRQALEKRAKELRISKHVRFTGFLSHDKTLQLMKASDMIVVPSSGEESFGMVFLEAYALGVPIVTTRFGGIANVVKQGKTGILVSPANSGELTDAVISLIKNKNLKARYIREGMKLVESDFTINKTLSRIDALVSAIK